MGIHENKKSGIIVSALDVLHPKTWWKKIVLILVLGLVFSGFELMFFADKNTYMGIPWYMAFYQAYSSTLLKFLASIYVFLHDIRTYIEIGAWFTITAGVGMSYLVTTIFYQPIHLFLNLFENVTNASLN